MIYSVKYRIGSRALPATYFRNGKWNSLLKCVFPAYPNTNTPVVLLIRFYVSPPSYVTVSRKDLTSEKVPAVRSYELCDYVLSFMEMLHHTLLNSYRQIVKIDMEKYYSSNPRTVFKFMKWDQYVYHKDNDTIHSQGEGFGADIKPPSLQSKSKGNESNKSLRKKAS